MEFQMVLADIVKRVKKKKKKKKRTKKTGNIELGAKTTETTSVGRHAVEVVEVEAEDREAVEDADVEHTIVEYEATFTAKIPHSPGGYGNDHESGLDGHGYGDQNRIWDPGRNMT
jgi:hypothetical protein